MDKIESSSVFNAANSMPPQPPLSQNNQDHLSVLFALRLTPADPAAQSFNAVKALAKRILDSHQELGTHIKLFLNVVATSKHDDNDFLNCLSALQQSFQQDYPKSSIPDYSLGTPFQNGAQLQPFLNVMAYDTGTDDGVGSAVCGLIEKLWPQGIPVPTVLHALQGDFLNLTQDSPYLLNNFFDQCQEAFPGVTNPIDY